MKIKSSFMYSEYIEKYLLGFYPHLSPLISLEDQFSCHFLVEAYSNFYSELLKLFTLENYYLVHFKEYSRHDSKRMPAYAELLEFLILGSRCLCLYIYCTVFHVGL